MNLSLSRSLSYSLYTYKLIPEKLLQACNTHLSPNSIIMEPHTRMDVPVGFTGIQEVPRELLTEFHIWAAATPLPGVLGTWEVCREVLHDTMYHTLPPVDGLKLQAVQFDAKGLLVPTPLLITAARLQFAHGACIGHCMYHACCCYGIGKRTLSEACRAKE